MNKKFDKGTLLSGICMLLAAGSFLANSYKDKYDEDAAKDEMREEVKREVAAQLAAKEV